MLVVLEAAGLLVDRIAADWHLAPVGPQRTVAQRTVAQSHAQGTVAASRPARSRRPLWAALRDGAARAVAALRHARERRRLIRVLSARDDRLLADIGISRDQIREVADAAVRRGPQHPSRLVSSASSAPASPAAARDGAAAVEAAANDNRPRAAA